MHRHSLVWGENFHVWESSVQVVGAVSSCQDLAAGELSSRMVMFTGYLSVTVSAGAVGPLRVQELNPKFEGMGNFWKGPRRAPLPRGNLQMRPMAWWG